MQAPYHLLSDAAGLRRPITKEWFLSNVTKTPTCWIWGGAYNIGATYKAGKVHKIKYGAVILSNNGNRRAITGAHRVAWQLWKGELSRQTHVLHKCDNGLCVNPDHLFLGSWRENNEDKVAKGRQRNGKDLITPRAVEKIRRLRAQGMKVNDILRKVFWHAVRATVSGQNWKQKPQTTKGS